MLSAQMTHFPERNLLYAKPAKKHAKHTKVHNQAGMTESKRFRALSSAFRPKIEDSKFPGL